MLTYEQIIRRFESAKANKLQWDSHLRECYEYAMPERNTIDDWSPGQKKSNKLFDSTAVDALEDYANRMESQLVPPSQNWMILESGTEIPEEQEAEVDKYLEETTDILFEHIRSSNFSSQIHEAFLDLGISTGALIVEPGDGIQSSLNFRAVPLSQLYLERSAKGVIDTVFREFSVPVGDIKSTWQSAVMTDELNRIAAEDPSKEIALIEAIMSTENGMYESVLLYPASKDFLFREKLESSHWVVFRETTIPGEVYGRGRVMRVLADIKTLNKMKEDYLRGLNFQANPMFTATDDGIINPYNIKLKTGTIIPVGSNDGRNPSLMQMPITGKIELLDYEIRSLQDTIRRALMSKPFGNIEETPVRTATEMSIRNADLAETSVGASGRIQSELLERIIARSIYILKKAGKVAEMKVDGKEVRVKFLSPLSRKQAENDLATLGRFMEFMGMFPPEVVMQRVKVEDFPAEIADTLGVPKSLMRTDAEMAMIQQQQQAEQQQLEQQALAMKQGGQGGQ